MSNLIEELGCAPPHPYYRVAVRLGSTYGGQYREELIGQVAQAESYQMLPVQALQVSEFLRGLLIKNGVKTIGDIEIRFDLRGPYRRVCRLNYGLMPGKQRRYGMDYSEPTLSETHGIYANEMVAIRKAIRKLRRLDWKKKT